MPEIVIASDSDGVREEVRSILLDPDITVRELTNGDRVLPAVLEKRPGIVILDQQIGSMGAMAVCMELRLEESVGRAPHVPVLILVDRRPDVHLARRSGAEGWVIKPLDAIRLRKAVAEVMADRPYHDQSYKPPTVAVPASE